MAALRGGSRAFQQRLIARARESGLAPSKLTTRACAAQGDGVMLADVARTQGLSLEQHDRARRSSRAPRPRSPACATPLTGKSYTSAQPRTAISGSSRPWGPLLVGLSELAAALGQAERETIWRFAGELTALLAEHPRPRVPSTSRDQTRAPGVGRNSRGLEQ